MAAKGDRRSGRLLLVAEDNAADVGLIRLALEAHGIPCEIHAEPDGEGAIRFVERVEADQSARCPELFILDLNLPRFDGTEILRRIRASKRLAQVPVIVASSSRSSRDRNTALELGASAYFAKPSELAEFLELGALIRNFLGEPGSFCENAGSGSSGAALSREA